MNRFAPVETLRRGRISNNRVFHITEKDTAHNPLRFSKYHLDWHFSSLVGVTGSTDQPSVTHSISKKKTHVTNKTNVMQEMTNFLLQDTIDAYMRQVCEPTKAWRPVISSLLCSVLCPVSSWDPWMVSIVPPAKGPLSGTILFSRGSWYENVCWDSPLSEPLTVMTTGPADTFGLASSSHTMLKHISRKKCYGFEMQSYANLSSCQNSDYLSHQKSSHLEG